MSPQHSRSTTRASRSAVALTAVAAGVGLAVLAVLAGATVAKTFTLHVAKHAMVTNQAQKTVHEDIVVNSKSRAVYWLSGETKSRAKCTKVNGCFSFWPPVKVASKSSLSKAPGVPGKLGVWHRDGFNQVTLGGHPLYTFGSDGAKNQAGGQGAKGFGGTWSVVKARSSGSGSTQTTTTTTTTGTGLPTWG